MQFHRLPSITANPTWNEPVLRPPVALVPGTRDSAMRNRQATAPAVAPSAAAVTILDIRNLSRSFGGLVAVSDLSFSIGEGEIRGLIGPNGAGKTTTFNVISGFYPPSTGRVLFRGEDVSGCAPAPSRPAAW